MNVREINFDEQDRDLFLIDDLQLKADAIRYSILPKLETINNEIVSRIIALYSIDFFKHYSCAKSPHFRLSKTQRKEPTKTNYTHAGVSIIGQRKDDKWLGLKKATEKVPKISPTSMSIELTYEGLCTSFFFNHPKNFTVETYKKFFDFFIDNGELISSLAHKSELNYDFHFRDCFSVVEDLKYKFESGNYDILISSAHCPYPIDYEKINYLIYSNVIFFPVLNSCIQIALGREPEIAKDLIPLEKGILPYIEKYFEHDDSVFSDLPSDKGVDLNEIKLKAEKRIKVQAGIRWQVMQRDRWKCCACGRSAADNVILHIDHIIPRSKGGKDTFENYQTLCDYCNIGKSDKDDTDLRRFC